MKELSSSVSKPRRGYDHREELSKSRLTHRAGSFETLDDARRWFASFFAHYNFEHYHSGIGLLTPASVHNGTAGEIIEARQRVLDDAFEAHPERFRQGRPTPAAPDPAWINKPADANRKEQAVTQLLIEILVQSRSTCSVGTSRNLNVDCQYRYGLTVKAWETWLWRIHVWIIQVVRASLISYG
jgi:hypothetical protein